MRKADIITAVVILAWCVVSMFDAAKLNIGWVKNVGPGGGFLPFWLCAVMGLFTLIVLIQAIRSKDTGETFFKSEQGRKNALKVFYSTFGCVVAYVFIGAYFGSIAYLGFYLRFIGKRSWLQTAIVSIGVPLGIWLLFELFLKITLPKGLPMMEDFWYAVMPA
jgi:putative tricarboxylic transport membrane protein